MQADLLLLSHPGNPTHLEPKSNLLTARFLRFFYASPLANPKLTSDQKYNFLSIVYPEFFANSPRILGLLTQNPGSSFRKQNFCDTNQRHLEGKGMKILVARAAFLSP